VRGAFFILAPVEVLAKSTLFAAIFAENRPEPSLEGSTVKFVQT